MKDSAKQRFDFCDIWPRREALLEKTKLPLFSSWWSSFIESQQTLELSNNPIEQIESIAFAYAISDDEALGQKALNYLRKELPTYIPPASVIHKEMYPEVEADLTVASACKKLAYTYNFLYPLLESTDKQLIFNQLVEKGAGIIYHDTLAGAWWSNAPNSNWCSHLLSGLALSGIVLMEDDPDLSEKWINAATKPLKKMLDLAGEEGAGIEGTGYWCGCYRSVQEWTEAARNIGRDDWYSHPFWQRAVEFPLYMSRPDKSGLMNFGDTGEGLGMSHFFYAIANALDHGLAQWFGNQITVNNSPSRWDLLYYNPNLEPTPPDYMPTDRLFKSVHLASFRSSWEEDAVFFILKGGSNAWSHCHLDLNSFFIDAYGERLVVDPGPGDYSSHYFTSVDPEVSTAWHNTLLVDNADQRQPPRYRMSFDLEEGGDAYCRLTDMASSYKIGMICGDATTAYGDYLDRFFRHIVYLKPNRFVIYDSIRAREVRTQRHYQWLLHSGFPIIDNNDGTLEIQGEKSKLVIHPILPLLHAIKSLPTRLPKNGKAGKEIHAISLRPEWHHLWNISPKSSPYPQWDPRSHGLLYNRDLQFMVVLTVLPRKEKYQYEIKPIIQNDLHGIKFIQDDETDLVFFNPNGRRFEDSHVISDAEKVVIRQKGDEILDWSIVNGKQLIYDGIPVNFQT